MKPATNKTDNNRKLKMGSIGEVRRRRKLQGNWGFEEMGFKGKGRRRREEKKRMNLVN